jgi:hypothetical protein
MTTHPRTMARKILDELLEAVIFSNCQVRLYTLSIVDLVLLALICKRQRRFSM